MVGLALPGAALRWTNAYARDPLWFLLCAGLVALLLWLSASLKGRITDQMRLAWRREPCKSSTCTPETSKTPVGVGRGAELVVSACWLDRALSDAGLVRISLPKAPASLQTFIDRMTHPYFQFFAFAILITMWLPGSTIARFRLKDAYRQAISDLKLKIAPAFFASLFLVGGSRFRQPLLFNFRDSFGEFCKPVGEASRARGLRPGRYEALQGGLPTAASRAPVPPGVPRRPPGRIRHHAIFARRSASCSSSTRFTSSYMSKNGDWSFLGAPSSPGECRSRAFLPRKERRLCRTRRSLWDARRC